MGPFDLECAFRGHFVLGPTGESTRCLRCGKELDGLGLDPDLDSSPAPQPASGDARH